MIDFGLGDELEMIRATARDFAADHLRPNLREHEKARGLPAQVHSAFIKIGFATLEWPEALGGDGLGALARSLVLEELSAADPGASLALDPLGPALYPLLEMSDPECARVLGQPLIDAPGSRALLVWNVEHCKCSTV